jgi:hypothetical protein
MTKLTELETTILMVEHCKNERDKNERLLCWVSTKEYYDIEEHKRCEYMMPLERGITIKETKIYCNYHFSQGK